MVVLRNPALHRRVPRLQAMAHLKAAQLPRAAVHRLHLGLQLLKGARTNSRDETENAASRGGVSFFLQTDDAVTPSASLAPLLSSKTLLRMLADAASRPCAA